MTDRMFQRNNIFHASLNLHLELDMKPKTHEKIDATHIILLSAHSYQRETLQESSDYVSTEIKNSSIILGSYFELLLLTIIAENVTCEKRMLKVNRRPSFLLSSRFIIAASFSRFDLRIIMSFQVSSPALQMVGHLWVI